MRWSASGQMFLHASLPGLTRQSTRAAFGVRDDRLLDARVKPGHDVDGCAAGFFNVLAGGGA